MIPDKRVRGQQELPTRGHYGLPADGHNPVERSVAQMAGREERHFPDTSEDVDVDVPGRVGRAVTCAHAPVADRVGSWRPLMAAAGTSQAVSSRSLSVFSGS